MDALLLARMQFAANITFHILFPTITIALGWMLLFFRWRWLKTQDAAWLGAYRFWTKVFALSFALGVVSGIVMSFQFGTNWPGFMERVGNIAGPLLGYEVLTAFFLEASFLGIMLFGHGRVSERVHLIATFLVAFGTTMSAFWILALNSWMHTPAGYEIRDGEFFVRSWFEVVFNPSFPYRFVHMMLASGLTAAFAPLAVVAPLVAVVVAIPIMSRTGIRVSALWWALVGAVAGADVVAGQQLESDEVTDPGNRDVQAREHLDRLGGVGDLVLDARRCEQHVDELTAGQPDARCRQPADGLLFDVGDQRVAVIEQEANQ